MNLESLSPLFPGIAMWKKDIHSVFTTVNPYASAIFGYRHSDEVIGKRDEDHPCKIAECSEIFQKEDQKVINSKKTRKFIEILCCAEDEWKIFLVTKVPDIQNKIIQGTFATCVDFTKAISKFNMTLSTKKKKYALLQKSYSITAYDENLKLSPKQTSCLFYLLRGKTAKEIALVMNISPRTVESHIDQLKNKFNVNKKSELIEKAIDNDFHLIIPEFLLKEQETIIL